MQDKMRLFALFITLLTFLPANCDEFLDFMGNTADQDPDEFIYKNRGLGLRQRHIAYYNSLIKSSYFYGNWMADGIKAAPGFVHQEGFVMMNYVAHEISNYQLTIYDGMYVDQKLVVLDLEYPSSSPAINETASTLTYENLWAQTILRDGPRLFPTSGFCLTNLSFYFEDLQTNQPLIPNLDADIDPNNVGIQVRISSEYCPFKLTTTLLSNQDKLIESQYTAYAAVTLFFIIGQCVLIYFFHNILVEKPLGAKKTSAWSFLVLTAFDFYLIIFNMSSFPDPLTYYTVMSLPYLILCLNMQRVIWTLIDTQIQDLEMRARDGHICKMYICNDQTLVGWLLTLQLGTYIMLIVPTFVAFFLLDDFVFYLTALFLLPQIIKNAKDCQKYKTKPWIIAGIIIPKLLMLGYLRLDPNNIFRYSPKLNVVIGVVAVILIQVITLLIQTQWPRFGLEPTSSYLIFEVDSTKPYQNVCAICLEHFVDLESGLDDKSESLLNEARRMATMIRTPCKHEFHEHCLKRWMESKLECPYCRHSLPSLVEATEDDF